ncbi:MAG: hypothetical protein ABIH78_00345 [Candidatus Peregrinibacteria bacterium]
MKSLLLTVVAVLVALFATKTAVFGAPGDPIPTAAPVAETGTVTAAPTASMATPTIELNDDCLLTGRHAKELLGLIAALEKKLAAAEAQAASAEELEKLRKELDELKAARAASQPPQETPTETEPTGYEGWFWSLVATGGVPVGTSPVVDDRFSGLFRVDGGVEYTSPYHIGFEIFGGIGGWGMQHHSAFPFTASLEGDLVVAWKYFSLFGGEGVSVFQSPFSGDNKQWYGQANLGGGLAVHINWFLVRVRAAWVHWSECPEWGGALLTLSLGYRGVIGGGHAARSSPPSSLEPFD